ncbi:hypothetical protein BWP39_05935 [Paraburkholderia acidicola]|uniref:Uncharacterized protein n=1 Tax=Paraburkholderia acidicola TaxID=1912599 RepID=A0A2A4F633_9BURK|nr:hypothetical protein BWP39_05935 [Paraburkholderia acidicola]
MVGTSLRACNRSIRWRVVWDAASAAKQVIQVRFMWISRPPGRPDRRKQNAKFQKIPQHVRQPGLSNILL